MFPPGRDSAAGQTPADVRGAERRGRPASLVVAVLLLAAFWTASAGVAAWAVAHDHRHHRAGGVAGMMLWTAMVVLLLWRVWHGDRRSVRLLAHLGTRVGVVFLVGAAALTVLTLVAPPGGSARTGLVYLVASVVAGLVLLWVGILLRRPEIREWSGS